MKVIRAQCVPGSNRVASCGHTVGLNGVLWVYGFMGARWSWCGINNINLSQARRRREEGEEQGGGSATRQEILSRVLLKRPERQFVLL